MPLKLVVKRPQLPSPAAIKQLRARRELKSTCTACFYEFAKAAWPVVEPAKQYIDNWHVRLICDHLQAVEQGEIQNLLITIPPGHAKSIIVAVLWQAWCWLRKPWWRFLCATYSHDLTLRDAARTRLLLKSDWYQQNFRPTWQISDDQDAKFWFQNSASGFRYSTSVGGQSTGHRGNCIIVDDALSATDANSEAKRLAANFWWDQAFANRLNDLSADHRVIISQRLHANDLAGHVVKEGNWTVVSLPTEFESTNRCETKWGRDPRTVDGELLFGGLFPASIIELEKRRLGSYGFASQHQQRPSPLGGGKFSRLWYRYFDELPSHFTLHCGEVEKRVTKASVWLFQTWDLALGTKESNCWTVGATWGITPEADMLLLDVDRFRAEGPDVEKRIKTSALRWQPLFQAIEKAHYGQAVCQKWINQGFSLKELIADRDKVTRAIPAGIAMENGKIYFRLGAAWLNDFETELEVFPNGEFDDQVDVLAYAERVRNEHAVQAITDELPGEPDFGADNKLQY